MDSAAKVKIKQLLAQIENSPSGKIVVSQEDAQFLMAHPDIYTDVSTDYNFLYYNECNFQAKKNVFSNPLHPTYTVECELNHCTRAFERDPDLFEAKKVYFQHDVLFSRSPVDFEEVNAFRNTIRDYRGFVLQENQWSSFKEAFTTQWNQYLDERSGLLSVDELPRVLQGFLNRYPNTTIGDREYTITPPTLPENTKDLINHLQQSVDFEIQGPLYMPVITVSIDGIDFLKACEKSVPNIMEYANKTTGKKMPEHTEGTTHFNDHAQKQRMIQEFQESHPDLVIGSAEDICGDFVAFDQNGVAIAIGLDERLYTESELSEHIAQLEQLVEQDKQDLESEDPDIDEPDLDDLR